METQKKVIVRAVAWSPLAAEMLASATLTATVEDYRRQVEEGAALFEVADEAGQVLGFYVLRIDDYAEKTVGVLVAAAGVPGFSFADSLMPVIENQFLNCAEITQYCSRPGMVRKLAAQGWAPTHVVMRKVKHG